MISLEKTSRLRKLKKTESEKEVRVDVFEKRLKQHHDTMISSSDIFGWARKAEE